MIRDLVTVLAMVAVVEGLVLAVAPGRLRELIAAIDALGPDRVRVLGLAAVAAGVALVWMARA